MALGWLTDDLPAATRDTLADRDNAVWFSAINVWEIEIKRALGKLDAPDGVAEAFGECGFDELAVTSVHAETAAALPAVHRDPFDRMLVAQAQVEGLTLVTGDRDVARYEVPVLAVRGSRD